MMGWRGAPVYLSESQCGGNNGRLFSLLAIKIYTTKKKNKGKKDWKSFGG